MEFSQLDDSKSSSDETDRSDQINDETGNGARSYGCVFCKRGFTTAQALGGHMNIHRKDRAKNRPSSVTPPMYDESSLSLRSFPMISSYPPYYTYTSAPEPYVRYPVFLPASTWDISRPSYNSHVHNELPFMQADLLNRDFFAEEYWRRNPDSQAGPSNIGGDHGGPKRRAVMEEEIDLELRLGYDP